MSAVALRCSTCGTTQSHPGECEACLEGAVRYFCGNHTPGLWLDEPACHACGAKFGDAPARPAARRTSTTAEGPARTMRGPESRSPRPPGGELAGPRRRSPPPRPEPEDAPAAPSLADLLADIAEERTHRRSERRDVPWPPAAPGPRVSIPIVGCLFRLVLLVLFLIVLALAAVFVLLSA